MIIIPDKDAIKAALIPTDERPDHTRLFDLLRWSDARRVFIGTIKECPMPDRTNADWKCHKRISRNGVHCLGVHGAVLEKAYDNVAVQMQGC